MLVVTVKFGSKSRKVSLGTGATVEQALLAMKISPEVVIVRRGKEIIPDNERLSDGDVIEALKIVSGG